MEEIENGKPVSPTKVRGSSPKQPPSIEIKSPPTPQTPEATCAEAPPSPVAIMLPLSEAQKDETVTLQLNETLKEIRALPKEEELILEVLQIVQQRGGKMSVSDLELELEWSDFYKPVWGSLESFLVRHQRLFKVADDLVAVKRNKLDKNRIQRVQGPSDVGKVACLCVGDALDLVGLQKYFKRLDYSSLIAEGVLHVTNVKGYGSTFTSEATRFDLFAFSYGSIVWWGTESRTFHWIETDFLRASSNLQHIVKDRYSHDRIVEYFPVWGTYALDETSWIDKKPTEHFIEALQRDHFLLPSDKMSYKKSISLALAQSAKLDMIEPMVSELLQTCRPLPVQLRDVGHAQFSASEINKLKGKQFLYSMMIKHDSELLDEPEYLWEHPEYAPLYYHIRGEYSIVERKQLLDQQLETVGDILTVCGNKSKAESGNRIEMIVIYLLSVEVVIALIELALGIWKGQKIYEVRP